MREPVMSVCSRSPFPIQEVGYFIETQKKYGIIYADPPWRSQQKNLSGAAEHHYSTMSVGGQICQLDVASVERMTVLFCGRLSLNYREAAG